MIRAAIVGLGWWGQRIWSSLQGSERIAVVRGMDVTFDHLGEFAERSGLSLTDSYDEVLGDSSVDAVILTTPHGLHEAQVVAAAGAGKKIFCEKPLALNGASARRMMEACAARGILLGIGHERRYEPAMIEVKRMVDDGEIGTLRHLEVNWSYALMASAQIPAWRQDPAQAPAGLMTAVGVHITDYLQSIAGPVARARRDAHAAPRGPALRRDARGPVRLRLGRDRLHVQYRPDALLPADNAVRRRGLGRAPRDRPHPGSRPRAGHLAGARRGDLVPDLRPDRPGARQSRSLGGGGRGRRGLQVHRRAEGPQRRDPRSDREIDRVGADRDGGVKPRGRIGDAQGSGRSRSPARSRSPP